MNEKTAWNCFEHTGNVMDYLIYSQCKHKEEDFQTREVPDADRNRGIGNYREISG